MVLGMLFGYISLCNSLCFLGGYFTPFCFVGVKYVCKFMVLMEINYLLSIVMCC